MSSESGTPPEPRTVGELRALLSFYPDDMPLFVGGPELLGNPSWDLKEMRLEGLSSAIGPWYVARQKGSEEPATALELK